MVYLVRSRSTGSQFAVKRAKGLKDADCRNFLAELQTWIDLPEHPNLLSCRFFRNVGNEVLIFADYIEGGSLKDWIDSGKLYEGSLSEVLARLLDVAIQFAWGLHCVHETGLVHQDVKPANVLMRSSGGAAVQGVKPMVADYGLARARAAGGEKPSADSSHSILVSTAGGTQAYWSPEQSKGSPVTLRTDIWSWGVSVLEMFMGGVGWVSGLAAAAVLEQYAENAIEADSIPPMPAALVTLLRDCFQSLPSARPTSIGEVVENLKVIYQSATGAGYAVPLDAAERAPVPEINVEYRRRTKGGAFWDDPRVWLEKALLAAGRDPSEAVGLLAQRGATRQGELVADLAGYEEAKRIYERLVRDGRKDARLDLALLCSDKAMVHQTAADFSGATREYDQAISIWERLVNVEGRWDLANFCAEGYSNKAIAATSLGNHHSAVALYDRAIAIRERLVNQEGRRELANDLANTYNNKANAIRALGDSFMALALFDQVISIRESLVSEDGRPEIANNLAMAYNNKANAFIGLNNHRAAATLYGQAIVILERLINNDGRPELADNLAMACSNKAVALSSLGDLREALELCDQAIAIRERQVHQEGRRELANSLAAAYYNKANAFSDLGDHCAAAALYQQVITIRERLVNQEGRSELAGGLARAYQNKAVALCNLDELRVAVPLYDQAITISERLVNHEGRSDLAGDLAMAYNNKTVALTSIGDYSGGMMQCDQAIKFLDRMVNKEGRYDLADDLALSQRNRARLLKLNTTAILNTYPTNER